MLKEELKSKLEAIKRELKSILLDESLVDFTTFKFDEEVKNSSKAISKAIEEIE